MENQTNNIKLLRLPLYWKSLELTRKTSLRVRSKATHREEMEHRVLDSLRSLELTRKSSLRVRSKATHREEMERRVLDSRPASTSSWQGGWSLELTRKTSLRVRSEATHREEIN